MEISAHSGMKGVGLCSGPPLSMLTFTRPIPPNDPRAGEPKLLRNADCFLLLSISAAPNSQGERMLEEKRSDGYKGGLSRPNGIAQSYSSVQFLNCQPVSVFFRFNCRPLVGRHCMLPIWTANSTRRLGLSVSLNLGWNWRVTRPRPRLWHPACIIIQF